MWIKYRDIYAWGPCKEWIYIFIPYGTSDCKEDIDEWLNIQYPVPDYLDHYRKREWEETVPPDEVIKKEIKDSQDKIDFLNKKISLLKTTLISK